MEGDDIFFAAHQLEIDPVVRQGFVGQGQIDGPVQQVLGQLLGGAVQLPDADFRVGGGKGGQLIRQISPDVAAQREHILGSGIHALNILDAGVEFGKGDVHAGEKHAAVVVELDFCPSGGRRATPSSSSSLEILLLRLGWVTYSSAAARVMLPVRATA